jgi:imidazolonepropionase
MHQWDELWRNATIATMVGGATPYGLLQHGAIALAGGRIAWVGQDASLDVRSDWHAARLVDLGGGLVTPGLIDCHTHLVHAGHRSGEIEARLRGDSYAVIAARGGGILSTVRATRAASQAQLVEESAPRLAALAAEGVTTVEIKSGYGLELDTELRMLSAARVLGERLDVSVETTFLGAHAVPPEFAGAADAYVRHLCDDALPAVAQGGLASAVDAFCETIAFTPAQTRALFEAARRHGLRCKLHADQLSDGGGAALAADFGALSADHLEFTSPAGVRAMARSGTIAVMLPVAFYLLRESRRPPVAALRESAVPMAVSTDCNPGTAPAASLLMAMNMACVLFGLSPEEAFAGVTRNAAAALGRLADRGTLEAGKRADLLAWAVDDPARLVLEPGVHRPRMRHRGAA